MPLYGVDYELSYSGTFTASVDAPHEAEAATRDFVELLASKFPGAVVKVQEAKQLGGIIEVGD